MTIQIASLNSGSNANCYYIGNGKDAVLVDAGLSCRETEKRMSRLGLSIANVKGLFVSHEHSDHISGVSGIAKKHQLPVYVTNETLKGGGFRVEKHLLNSFEAGITIPIGELLIHPFVKSHDASDPHSFIVSGNGINIGVLTDIGYPCKEVINYFSQCHAVFLEANYCENMLENGGYPYYLKKRISSDKGHLSNTQALDLFTKYRPSYLSHLILSHLSKNNNDPALVKELFSSHAGNTTITVASRYEESQLITIESEKRINISRLGQTVSVS